MLTTEFQTFTLMEFNASSLYLYGQLSKIILEFIEKKLPTILNHDFNYLTEPKFLSAKNA